jgi:LPXTG-site transpeptidase (sortase) family protein
VLSMSLTAIRHTFIQKLPSALILVGVLLLFLSFGPLIRDELWFFIKETRGQQVLLFSGTSSELDKISPFARFLKASPILVEPVDTDFGIVIERIGVNAPVVKDVSVYIADDYFASLKNGVAHASSSPYPSQEAGNVYVFAHASLNFWKLGKYATVFNLLRKLSYGDKIHIFYEDEIYVYSVIDKERVKGWDTYPLTRPTLGSILTLQTCDPPGTTLNRMVVTAMLEEVLPQSPVD